MYTMVYEDKVCAIVVTYKPCLETLQTLLCALRPQLSQIVVVDNGSGDKITTWLRSMDDIEFIELGANLGVANAHNQGIKWALARDYSHVLLMDHDSVPMPNMVPKLLEAMTVLRARNVPVAAVGPIYRNPVTGHSSYFVRFGWLKIKKIFCDRKDKPIAVDFMISSGSLISVDALTDVGFMDEGLFIDHVDTEWFVRAGHKGYQTFGVCEAVMSHSLGECGYRIWLGRWRYVPLHSPLRCYYKFRNSLLLYKRNYMPWCWVVNDLVRLLSIGLFYLLFIPRRTRYAAMMIKGIWHGITGKVGSYERNRTLDTFSKD